MPANDTKQSNSYCPKHNTQHKAIFLYTFTPHLKLPVQIFLQIVDEKKLHPRDKIFFFPRKNILSRTDNLFSKAWNLFSKAWKILSKLWKIDSKVWKVVLHREEKIYPSGEKSFSIVMQYFAPRQQKNSYPQENSTKHLQNNFYTFA